MALYTEGGTDALHDDAVKIMELLTTAYPGHPWAVRIDGGVIFIRYLDLNLSGNWGMCLKVKEVDHDAAVLKRKVILMAGEWLERSGLARGPANGDEIVTVEGVPAKYYPKPMEAELIEAAPDFRSSPRPQAVKNE